MKKSFRIHPALGLMGVLGVLGFFTDPFFCIFFGFFGFFFWGLLGREQSDERLEENQSRAMRFCGGLAILLCFFLLFALEKKVAADTVLLVGSALYGLLFTLAPALTWTLDKRG